MERSRANGLLWIGQVVLAIVFLMQGIFKFWQPSGLPDQLSWVYDVTGPMAVFLGVAELAAVAGLLLPGITGILPILTPLAALGLVPIMAGATLFHLNRGEIPSAILSAAVGLIAAAVAYGRWRVAPLPARAA
jgi:uncharacterized membrane protein YphA (DoxX/SURF4 family)